MFLAVFLYFCGFIFLRLVRSSFWISSSLEEEFCKWCLGISTNISVFCTGWMSNRDG